MIKVKRIYDPAKGEDGFRILVDRLWPRGVSKAAAGIDSWLRDVAPSDTLRKWFAHDPKKWTTFKRKYCEELRDKKDLIRQIQDREKENGTVTLLYSAKDDSHNQAVALICFLKSTRHS
jgi:uncharacterized protein YeaO (DUF488 family)